MGACCSKPQAGAIAAQKPPVDWENLKVPKWTPLATGGAWNRLGGEEIEALLEHVDLVDLKYAIENTEAGRPMPRWQDIPRGARINRHNLHRIQTCAGPSLAVLVLSYPWLDAGHPDKDVRTMRRLLPCLKAFLEGVTRYGRDCTVGLMMDYPCLPQKSADGVDDRSDEEKARFKRGLETINEWYAHPATTVVIFDVDMPGEDSGHSNLRPHSARGWCDFELRASSLVKNSDCLWSLRGYEMGGSKPYCDRAVVDAREQITRPPPMTPEDFAELLRAGVGEGRLAFTAKADLDVVIGQYGKAFEAAFRGEKTLWFQKLGWHDAEVETLARALAAAKERGLLEHCERIHVDCNPCGEAGLIALAEALKETSCHIYAMSTKCSKVASRPKGGMSAVEKVLEGREARIFL